MLAAGEVQGDVATLAGRHDPAGEHARALVGWLAFHAQHAHAGIVVMRHFALRRLANQLLVRRLDRLRGFLDDVPLRGCRQRNAQLFFQTLQPVKGNAAAVVELRDHCRRRFVVLLRTHAFRLLGREHLPAGIAAQPLQFVDRGRQRRLTDDPHQRPGFLLQVDVAAGALRAAIAVGQFVVRDADGFRTATIRGRVVAPMPGTRLCSRRIVWRRRLRILEYGAGLLCFALWPESLGQRVQGRFELLAVRFAQGSAACLIDDAVQLFHIYVHTTARGLPFHNLPSNSRNFGVSG